MHSGILWQVIYWSPVLGLAALVLILLQRRLTREFPFFFSYLVVDWVKDIACIAVYYKAGPRSHAYFYTYWLLHLVSVLFLLLATLELSLTHLFPRFYKLRFYRHLFAAAALFALMLAAFAASQIGGWYLVLKAIQVIDSLHVVSLLFFVGLMLFMGRQWARYEFAIALGLGVNAVALIILFVSILKWGALRGPALELPAIADALICLIWLITFLRPEKQVSVAHESMHPEALEEARRWEKVLRDSLGSKKPPINRTG